MPSVINTNIASLNSQTALTKSQNYLQTAMERLSSGLRINSSKDDAAGLSIATKMSTQIRGMNVATRNSNDGVSLAQTADSALATAVDALLRMRDLAVQSINGSNSTNDRTNLDTEYQALSAEITRIASATKFNGLAILDADAGTIAFQVGANVGDTLDVTTAALVTVAGDITSVTNSETAIGAIDTALDTINGQRAQLGAVQNRLGYAIDNLQTGATNQSAARSRILDTDFAAETAALTRGQILQQAGTAMLAQANTLPNTVLTLLK